MTLQIGMGVQDAHMCTGALGSLILSLYTWAWESRTPMCALVLGVLDSITLQIGMGVLDAHVCTGVLGSLILSLYT